MTVTKLFKPISDCSNCEPTNYNLNFPLFKQMKTKQQNKNRRSRANVSRAYHQRVGIYTKFRAGYQGFQYNINILSSISISISNRMKFQYQYQYLKAQYLNIITILRYQRPNSILNFEIYNYILNHSFSRIGVDNFQLIGILQSFCSLIQSK